MSHIGWRFQILVPSQQFFYRVGPTWLNITSFLGFLGGSPVNFGGISTKMGPPRTVEWLPPCTSESPFWQRGTQKVETTTFALKQLNFSSGIFIQQISRNKSNIDGWRGGGGGRELLHDACFWIFSLFSTFGLKWLQRSLVFSPQTKKNIQNRPALSKNSNLEAPPKKKLMVRRICLYINTKHVAIYTLNVFEERER